MLFLLKQFQQLLSTIILSVNLHLIAYIWGMLFYTATHSRGCVYTENFPKPTWSQDSLNIRKDRMAGTPCTVCEGMGYRDTQLHRAVKTTHMLQTSFNSTSGLFLQIWAAFQCHTAPLMLQHLRTHGKKKHSCPFAEVWDQHHKVTRYQCHTQGRWHCWFNHKIPSRCFKSNLTLKKNYFLHAWHTVKNPNILPKYN